MIWLPSGIEGQILLVHRAGRGMEKHQALTVNQTTLDANKHSSYSSERPMTASVRDPD